MTSQKDMTAAPSKYPQGRFKDKPCRTCGTVFSPQAPSHLHCSDKCKQRSADSNYLRKNYGITVEEYEQMFIEQDYKCKICGTNGFKIEPNARQLLAVDHCHTTGMVRGLLCHNCNRALGLFQDDVRNLSNAIAYLNATTIPNGSTPK